MAILSGCAGGGASATSHASRADGAPLAAQRAPDVVARSQRLGRVAAQAAESVAVLVDQAGNIGPVEATLSAQGFSVSDNVRLRLVIAHGSAAATERVFGVQLFNWHDPKSGRDFYANASSPRMPDHVSGVLGLDNFATGKPLSQGSTGSNAWLCGGGPCYTAEQIRRAYNADTLVGGGIDGRGQTVDVFATGGFAFADDIGQFDEDNGLASPQITVSVPAAAPDTYGLYAWQTVPGNSYSPSHDDREKEAELDIEAVHGVAPGAGIHVYEATGDFDKELVNFLDGVSQDGASVATISYGQCESDMAGSAIVISGVLQNLAESGVSVFAATGDNGSQCWDYTDSSGNDHNSTGVNMPASSPWVTAVGGTQLTLGSNDTISGEQAWDEPSLSPPGASGGGVSTLFAPQPWQFPVSKANGRAIPDVSATAAPDGGLRVTEYFGGGVSVTTNGGGTSLSSPLWAAMAAIYDQSASAKGVAPMGLAAQLLYSLASRPNRPVFDVTSTQNGGKELAGPATTGWDLATGLGTPNLAAIVQDGLANASVSLRTIDWTKVLLPADACYTTGPAQLRGARQDGFPSTHYAGWSQVSIDLEQDAATGNVVVSYGDLEGSGHVDAAIHVVCDTGGFTGSSTLQESIVVFSGDGGLHVIGVVHPVLPSAGNATAFTNGSIAITGGTLSADESGFAAGDPACCPSLHRSDLWSWTGSGLHLA